MSMIVAASYGFSVRRSMTSRSIPSCASFSAASSERGTMIEVATTVSVLAGRRTSALPSGTM